jgi:hypothetical protein
MEAFLQHMGINPQDALAAFVGSVCGSLATTGSKPTVLSVVTGMLVGTGVGAYGGPVLPTYLGYKPNGFATFLIGACGLPIIRAAQAAASRFKWTPAAEQQPPK